MINDPDGKQDEQTSQDKPGPSIEITSESYSERQDAEREHHQTISAMWFGFRSFCVAVYRRINRRVTRWFRWLLDIDANRVIALAAIVTAAATIVYTLYARRQWSTMSQTLGHVVSNDAGASLQTDKIVAAASKMEGHLKQMVTDNKTMLADNKQAITNALKDNREELAKALGQNRDALANSISQGEKALNTSIESSRIDRRAWLGVSTLNVVQFDKAKSLKLEIGFINSGRTPALQVKDGTKWRFNSGWVAGPAPDWPTNFLMEPQQSVPPQGSFVRRIEMAQRVFGPHYEAIKAGTEFVYFYGQMTYADISETVQGWTQTSIFIRMAEPDKPELSFCSTFNDMK
jgi:hypothetical protein